MNLQHITVFDPDNALEHIKGPAPNPVSGSPVTNLWRCYYSDDKKIHAGFWSCENGSFCIESHTSNEMCAILEGEAIVEMGDGTKYTIKAGDSIFIPYGIKNTWHVKDYVRKSYVCYLP